MEQQNIGIVIKSYLIRFKPLSNPTLQNPTLIIQEYRPIQYAYSCDYCVKKIIKVKEMFCGPFTDPEGNKHHCHDYNTGQVEVFCEDNHISKTHYVACCECGWTNNKRLPL